MSLRNKNARFPIRSLMSVLSQTNEWVDSKTDDDYVLKRRLRDVGRTRSCHSDFLRGLFCNRIGSGGRVAARAVKQKTWWQTSTSARHVVPRLINLVMIFNCGDTLSGWCHGSSPRDVWSFRFAWMGAWERVKFKNEDFRWILTHSRRKAFGGTCLHRMFTSVSSSVWRMRPFQVTQTYLCTG